MTAKPPTDETTETPTDLPPATNVIVALARVQAEIGGIEKLTAIQRQQRGQGGGDTGISYAYRGIDQIAAAAQPLLGKHGIVIVPEVASRETNDITVANKPWTDTIVLVNWTIYGPGGAEDRITARTEGWGRDNSDKGINKAMTGAYKNLLLRLLTIGDPQDDTDGHTNERDGGTTSTPPAKERALDDADRVDAVEVFEALKKLSGDEVTKFQTWLAGQDSQHPALTVGALADHPEWRDLVAAQVAEIMTGYVADAPTDGALEFDAMDPLDGNS